MRTFMAPWFLANFPRFGHYLEANGNVLGTDLGISFRIGEDPQNFFLIITPLVPAAPWPSCVLIRTISCSGLEPKAVIGRGDGVGSAVHYLTTTVSVRLPGAV